VTVVLIADGIAVTALVGTAWAIDHLPLDLPHALAAQLVAAVVTVVFLTELGRFHTRRVVHPKTDTSGGEPGEDVL